MATYTKQKLSGSTDGRFILVSGINIGAAVTVHDAHATSLDEPILTAWNIHTDDLTLTIRYGDDADLLSMVIPANAGPISVLPQEAHLLLTNSLSIKAYASLANKIYLGGCCNRIT